MSASRYLVDTSAWLDALQGTPGRDALRARVRELLVADQVVTTGAVLAEVLRGARDEAEYRRLESMLGSLQRLQTEEEHWDAAARLGFRLRRRALTVGIADLLIATVAMGVGVTVLHANRHFDAIARHAPLLVESHM